MSESEIFDKLFIHFCRHPSFRAALSRSDPIMWRRLNDATLGHITEDCQ